ncbi:MAG: Ku protein [Candidatus Acidiferrales bacterium]
MAATVWKGHLTFGLISIPVRLFSAARGERLSFNQLHKECHSRIRQPLYCPTCERMVERTEIVKGYEYEKEQYVLFNDEELEKMAPASAKTMEILEFVRLAEVDPLFYDTSYYAVPEEAGRKAYYLLVKTMEESGYAAIAKVAMHQREYTVVVRPREGGLTMHSMYYENEIRKVEEYGEPANVEVKPQEVKLAQQLVESLAADFEPKKYHNEYQEQLKALIEAKVKGQEVTAPPERQLAPVIDLMEALKKSLAEREGSTPRKPPARAVAEEKAAAVAAAMPQKKARAKR